MIALSACLTQQDRVCNAEFRGELQSRSGFGIALSEKCPHLVELVGCSMIRKSGAARMPASPRKVGTHRHVSGKVIRLRGDPLFDQISDMGIVSGKRVERQLLVQFCQWILLERLLVPFKF